MVQSRNSSLGGRNHTPLKIGHQNVDSSRTASSGRRRSSIRIDLVASVHYVPLFKDVNNLYTPQTPQKKPRMTISPKKTPSNTSSKKKGSSNKTSSATRSRIVADDDDLLPGYKQSRTAYKDEEYEIFSDIFSDNEKDAYKEESSDNDYRPPGSSTRSIRNTTRRATRKSLQGLHHTPQRNIQSSSGKSSRDRRRNNRDTEEDLAELSGDDIGLSSLSELSESSDDEELALESDSSDDGRGRKRKRSNKSSRTIETPVTRPLNESSPFGGRLRVRKAVNYYIPPPP